MEFILWAGDNPDLPAATNGWNPWNSLHLLGLEQIQPFGEEDKSP